MKTRWGIERQITSEFRERSIFARINFRAPRKIFFPCINFRARATALQNFGINFRARDIYFPKNSIFTHKFHDFGLFQDFMQEICENSVLIFAQLNTAHNFGIKFRAFSGLCVKLRENQYARKLVPLRYGKSENRTVGIGSFFCLSITHMRF